MIAGTTRVPKEGETQGKGNYNATHQKSCLLNYETFLEYHFTTKEEMHTGINGGEYLEWVEYSDAMYGTR